MAKPHCMAVQICVKVEKLMFWNKKYILGLFKYYVEKMPATAIVRHALPDMVPYKAYSCAYPFKPSVEQIKPIINLKDEFT